MQLCVSLIVLLRYQPEEAQRCNMPRGGTHVFGLICHAALWVLCSVLPLSTGRGLVVRITITHAEGLAARPGDEAAGLHLWLTLAFSLA